MKCEWMSATMRQLETLTRRANAGDTAAMLAATKLGDLIALHRTQCTDCAQRKSQAETRPRVVPPAAA